MNLQIKECVFRCVSRFLRLLPSISAVLLVTLGLVVVSVWIAFGTKRLLAGILEIRFQTTFYMGILIGVAIALVALQLAVKGVPEYAMPLREATRTRFFVLSVLAGIVCVALFA